MSRKYIATIMNRHFVGENTFIFNTNHAVIGELDEKTKIFKDIYGHEYIAMVDETLMMSEIPYGYANILELDKLNEVLQEDLEEIDAIKEYEFRCLKIVYYVSKLQTGEVYCVPLNHEELTTQISSSMVKKDEIEIEDSNLLEENISNQLLDIDMDPEIASLIMDTINGVYTDEELKEIRKSLEMRCHDIENALDTIDSHMNTSKKDSYDLEIETTNQPLIKEYKNKINFSKTIDIDQVFNKVKKTLIAQDEPARRLITEIVRKEMYPSKKEDAILLTGDTGVGKTKLMKLLAKYINKPLLIVDSTQLTIPGYVGKDITEVLWDLYIKCDMDKEKAEHAIIYFDEIDKKGSPNKSDISGTGVLNTLLSFINGTEYIAKSSVENINQGVKINTTNIIKILGGAYQDVYKNLNFENEIGFGTQIHSKEEQKEPTATDFVEKSMMTYEFMGRTLIIKMNSLDVNGIKRILLESDESAIRIQKKIFAQLGTKLTFTDDYLNLIAENAVEKKTGARGINTVVDDSTWHAFDCVYSNLGEYSEVILDENTIKDPKNYKLVKVKTNEQNKK